LILTGFEAYIKSQTMPVYFFGDNLFPVWPESYAVEMTTVLLVTLAMLFMPKILSLILLIIQRKRLKEYGGFIKALISVFFETIFSVLTAPILMLYQTKFVFSILLRQSVGWPSQNRDDHRLGFLEAVQAHGGHTIIGLLAGYVSYEYVPDFFLWLIPVLAGLVLSIPVSMISSSASIGMAARKMGIFITPEEFKEPRIITLLKYRMEQNDLREQQRMKMLGLQSGQHLELADPATFSLHSALLPNRTHNKRVYHELRALIYKLIEDGPEKLSFADKRNLISDRDTLAKLHYLAWSQRKPFKD
jgi:membrane glycosyltransferase